MGAVGQQVLPFRLRSVGLNCLDDWSIEIRSAIASGNIQR